MSIIYHYTNSAGLIGIIENKVIWATNVWFMNDTGEATFGWEQIQAFLKGKEPSSEAEESVISAAESIGASFWTNPAFPDSYIACFTENANDLSQWRAYGGTTGFSIGFDANSLNRLAQSHVAEDPANSLLRKVVYSDKKQQEELQTLYDQHVLGKLKDNADPGALCAEFLSRAFSASIYMKHEAFQGESEWRLHFFIRKTGHVLKFRDDTMGITPYFEIPIRRSGKSTINAIREIRVGPQRHPLEAQRAVQLLLSKNDISGVEVHPSTIPLRAN